MKNTSNKLYKLISFLLMATLFISIIPFSASAYVDTVGDFTYDFNDTNYTAIVREYKGTAENVTVPATVSYLSYTYTVTEMTDVFKNNTTVKSVTVSNGIKSIDYYSFLNCTNLTSVTIPESVAKIGTGAFDGCSSLKTLVLPQSVTNIGGMAFRNCNNLTTLILPNGLPNLTPVERNAFENTAITDVFVRNGVNFTEYVDNKFPQSALSNTVKVWRYAEQGKTDGGKTKVSIDSVKDKDGNDWSNATGVPLSKNNMGGGYEIESIDAGICYKNEGGTNGWTVCGTHTYQMNRDNLKHWQECTVCNNKKNEEPHIWVMSVFKEVSDTETGEMKYECIDCGIVEKHPIPPLLESIKTVLSKTVTRGEDEIKCIVQDPYGILPNGAILNSQLSEGEERLNNIDNLDNTHIIEHVEFFDISLSESTSAPISQLNIPVRVLLQIPEGWDKEDIEVVRITASTDVEFDETIVTIGDKKYIAIWTDHFSPYAIIDKLVLSEVKDISDVSKTYDGSEVTEPTYTYSGEGQIIVKWYADDNGNIGAEISAPTNAGTYWVGVSPSADSTYNVANEVTKQFAIAKATPTISDNPIASCVIIGGKLSDSTLTGGVASVDGKFEWKDGTEVLDSKGTVQKTVVFTPNDAENYNTVEFDVDVTVVICDTASGEHDYADQKTNADEHWTVCAKCKTEEPDSREAHKGGTATCTAKAKCSVCGEEYGKMLDHKYEWIIDKEPTATEEGSKYEECTVCKAKQNENTAIPKTETNSPQTGDNSNIALWVALLFISGMGIVPTFLYDRKKRRTN